MSIGTSSLFSTEWMVERLRQLRPRSILDIGCGWGRWGFLAREFLEVWENRYTLDQWQVIIDAVDAHPETWTPVHEFVYDACYTVDIRYWHPRREYDVVIAGDVLEHMPKDDAYAVVDRLMGPETHVLVGIPLGWEGWEQGPVGGNEYAAHVGWWDPEDFARYVIDKAYILAVEGGRQYGLFDLAGRK